MGGRYDVSVRGTQNLERLFCVGTDMIQIFADKINVRRYITDARSQVYMRRYPAYVALNCHHAANDAW